MAKTSNGTNRHAWKHPDYMAAESRVMGLKQKASEVEDLIDRTHSLIASNRSNNQLQLAAEALANGLPEPTPGEMPADLAKLHRDRAILARAVDLAERSLREVEARVSAEIIAQVRGEYIEIVRRIYAAALALQAANDAEARFITSLEEGGTLLGLLQRLPLTRVYRDALDRFRAEAAEFHGLILD